MNQILNTKLIKKIQKHKQFFIIFFISVIAILFFVFFYIYIYNDSKQEHNKSLELSNNYELMKLYSTQELNFKEQDSDILGNIIIPTLNINYAFYNGYSEDLLKILPCRFFGEMPPKKGNLCITAHNYNDERFFGRINTLQKNDKIIIQDNYNNIYTYYVSKIYEVDENDLSPIKDYDPQIYTLTLITCNNLNKKRIIVKAY